MSVYCVQLKGQRCRVNKLKIIITLDNIPNDKSLIYIKSNSGPKMELWVIPYLLYPRTKPDHLVQLFVLCNLENRVKCIIGLQDVILF